MFYRRCDASGVHDGEACAMSLAMERMAAAVEAAPALAHEFILIA
ncbi:MAG: hypothetical protein ACFB6R_18435 [Alphaproteobacteria bacterium]